MTTTIQVVPTGVHPTDRDNIQAAIEAGYDEIVLMANNASGDRTDFNFGGALVDTDTGNGIKLNRTAVYDPYASPPVPLDDAIGPKSLVLFGAPGWGIPITCSSNLTIRGEVLGGLDTDGDRDKVVLDGASLAIGLAWGLNGSPWGEAYCWAVTPPSLWFGTIDVTIKDLHFKNPPGVAITPLAFKDLLLEGLKITNVRPVNFHNSAFAMGLWSLGALGFSGVPDANNPWSVLPGDSITVQDSVVGSVGDYQWDTLLRQSAKPWFPGFPGDPVYGISDVDYAGLAFLSPVDKDVLVQRNTITGGHASIGISSAVVPLNTTKSVTIVVINNSCYVAEDVADAADRLAECQEPYDLDENFQWTYTHAAIRLANDRFPLAPSYAPTTITQNTINTKNLMVAGVEIVGPCAGSEISKNTLDIGPSHHNGMDGFYGRYCIGVVSEKCPQGDGLEGGEDSEGYGCQDVNIEKNDMRGTALFGAVVIDCTEWIWLNDTTKVPFKDIRLDKNHHKHLDFLYATYMLGGTTHDCYLRIKPPKNDIFFLDFGTNNDVEIPGETNRPAHSEEARNIGNLKKKDHGQLVEAGMQTMIDNVP